MKELTFQDLTKYKELPFNVYNEKGQVVLYIGDLLTPGKILELKKAKVLIYDENYEKKSKQERENPLVMKRKMSKQSAFIESIENSEEDSEKIDEQNEMQNIEQFNSVNDLRINKKSIFSSNFQLSIKDSFIEIISKLKAQNYEEAKVNYLDLTEKISSEIKTKDSEIEYLSQLKLIGEYKICNPLNVAIISGFLAMKNTQLNINLDDIVLCGLMHDIGKIKIDQEIAYKKTLHVHEHAEYEKHVIAGYKIIKDLLKLGNKIARPALEHHVLIDGSGYPRNINFDDITDESKVIAVVNYYDKLTCNRTPQIITYNYEAGKALLNNRAKKYPADLVYDMANKYILNDKSKLSDLID